MSKDKGTELQRASGQQLQTSMEVVFKPYRFGGSQAEVKFPNGYGASIIGGGFGQYGDGQTTFELAVTHGDEQAHICYSTPIVPDGVIGWQTLEEIAEFLKQIEALAPNPSCKHERLEDDECR